LLPSFPAEALHLAHLMAAHGYFFPVEDHVLTVKNDGTLYRFQVSYESVCVSGGNLCALNEICGKTAPSTRSTE
jgi:hypothetical protein